MRPLLALVLALIVGCKSHTVIERDARAAVPAVAAGESVVLLGRDTRLAASADHDFVECVGGALGREVTTLRIVDQQTFLDALYPWFESGTAPATTAMLADLLEHEIVTRKFEELAVRYLIWIEGSTERVDSSGSIACSVSPAGGGCFGFKSWDDEADYVASVWHVGDESRVGRIGTRTHGTSYLPAVIVPLPLLARVKAHACDTMATQLSELLVPGGP